MHQKIKPNIFFTNKKQLRWPAKIAAAGQYVVVASFNLTNLEDFLAAAAVHFFLLPPHDKHA